ncbi:hypothetical protein NUACC21_18610 [Scytonema sp. NUACC21]
MNEADTPNNEAFVEPLESSNSPSPEQGSCPFYSVLVNETTAIAKVPLLAPAQDKQCESAISSDDAPQEDWVAEPDREKQQAIDSEFKKLLALNEELRSTNDDLYDQVQKLQLALAESEKAVEWQKKRSSVTESMLNQQAKELTAAQEEMQSLYQQLETATATVQRQESVIENHKTQLELNQQRLAQLERECSLIQSNYNEQSHQLVQAENACRELRTRLMRQQRQTLQFKAALEKCLEAPVPSYDALDDSNVPSKPSKLSKPVNSLFTYTQQPIKPWSGEQESFTDDDDDNPWGESSVTSTQIGNIPIKNQSSIWTTVDDDEPLAPTQPTDTPEIPPVSVVGASGLEQQLDDVIQMFFAAHPAPASPPSPSATNADSNPAAAAIWETTATPLADESETPKSAITSNSTEEIKQDWSEQLPVIKLSGTALTQEQLMNESTNSNSPSPLLYPHRPPKGRKSFSAVELPHFRPEGQ